MDVLPAQPPRGVSTIQGDFLSPAIQAEVRAYVLDPDRGRPRASRTARSEDADDEVPVDVVSYVDLERGTSSSDGGPPGATADDDLVRNSSGPLNDRAPPMSEVQDGRVVDVVLSDMSEPWEQTNGFSIKSTSDPYRRMMNVSGTPFRDHAGSMVAEHLRQWLN